MFWSFHRTEGESANFHERYAFQVYEKLDNSADLHKVPRLHVIRRHYALPKYEKSNKFKSQVLPEKREETKIHVYGKLDNSADLHKVPRLHVIREHYALHKYEKSDKFKSQVIPERGEETKVT